MKNKNIFLSVVFLAFSISFLGQNKESKWTAGISLAAAKYTTEESKIVGVQFFYQTPRFNISRYFFSGFTLDAGIATSLEQDKKYTTFDGSVRYDFNRSYKNVVPYLLLGGSFVNANAFTPTLNFGAGNTFWFSQKFGLNIQGMFRFSEDKFESQKSHLYASVGLVYSFRPRSLVPRLWE